MRSATFMGISSIWYRHVLCQYHTPQSLTTALGPPYYASVPHTALWPVPQHLYHHTRCQYRAHSCTSVAPYPPVSTVHAIRLLQRIQHRAVRRDLGVVELLDVTHVAHVVAGDEVDGDTLTPEAPGATDTMDVVLPVGGEVVVDDERDLLHVDATREEIGGDEHARGAGAELAHDELAALLVHVAVQRRDREVAARHLLEEPVHLAPRVDVDDGLRDRQRLVQVAQRLQLPVLPLHRNVELLDSLERELVLLHQDAHRVAHEVPRDLEHLDRHGRAEEADLHLRGQELEHVVDLPSHTHHTTHTHEEAKPRADLVLEAAGKHLVGLVEHEDLHAVCAERAAVDHVVHAARRAHDNLLPRLQPPDVLPHVGSADARVALRLAGARDRC
eukprot:2251261-Rhodomonas_salina.2